MTHMNVELPTDPKTVNGNCSELEDCLAAMKTIITSTQFNCLQISGDLNYVKERNTSYCRIISE